MIKVAIPGLVIGGRVRTNGGRTVSNIPNRLFGGVVIVPSGSTIPEVADANARLSIDPTGKSAGYKVKQLDDGLTYTFNGDGLDADAGLWVTGAGNTDYNGPYIFNGSNQYDKIGGGFDVKGPGVWSFEPGPSYTGDGPYDYAWQSLGWIVESGFGTDPTVTRNPIAATPNWTP